MILELTDTQVAVVMEALDHYSRMGQGQLEHVTQLLEKYFEHIEAWDLVHEEIRKLKSAAFPGSQAHTGNGSWGITNQKVPVPFRIAYEIQQVMRGDEHPLKITTEPLAKIL